MTKDHSCFFGCDGCINMLLEVVAFFGVFFVAIAATALPLIAP